MKFYSSKLEELRNVRKTEQCNEVTGKEHEPDCEITINDAVVNLQKLEDGKSEELKENDDEELESENEGDIHHLVKKLERQVEQFNEKIEVMYIADQIV